MLEQPGCGQMGLLRRGRGRLVSGSTPSIVTWLQGRELRAAVNCGRQETSRQARRLATRHPEGRGSLEAFSREITLKIQKYVSRVTERPGAGQLGRRDLLAGGGPGSGAGPLASVLPRLGPKRPVLRAARALQDD